MKQISISVLTSLLRIARAARTVRCRVSGVRCQVKTIARGLALLAAGWMLLNPRDCAAESEVVVTALPGGPALQYIKGFELAPSLYSSAPPALVFWQGNGDCSVEFHSDSILGYMGQDQPGFIPNKPIDDCSIAIAGAAGDQYSWLYFAASSSSTGGVYRTISWKSSDDPPIPLQVFPLSQGLDVGALTLYNGKIYWSVHNSTYFSVRSMDPNGSNVSFVLVHPGGRLIKIAGFSYPVGSFQNVDVLFMLTATGDLIRFDFGVSSAGTLIASDVTDFALRHESVDLGIGGFLSYSALYYTTGRSVYEGKAPGSLVRVNIGTGASAVLYTAPQNSHNQLTAVGVDDQNIYWNEQPMGCDPQLGCSLMDGYLYRRSDPADHSTPPSAPQLIGLPGGDSGVNLRSDGSFLLFQYKDKIKRISTSAPELLVNLQADGLEVVQAIQSLNIDVPIVANHPTYVRGYAHFQKDTTGKINWQVGAQLRGFTNGVELPGSPIHAVRSSPLFPNTTLAAQRASTRNSFLFQLPPDWVHLAATTPSAQLNFQMTVNPFLAIPETDAQPLSDNSVWLSKPAALVHGGRPCLVMVPLVCKGPIFNSTTPYYCQKVMQVVRDARVLLPAEDFDVFPFLVPDAVGDWNNPLDFGIADFDKANGIWESALGYVEGVHIWSDPCKDQDEHFVGMVTPGLSKSMIGGIASRPGKCLAVEMSGLFLAHELGHNYGRRHIHCPDVFPPGQNNFDDVLFPCSLGDPNRNPASATFGYDPSNDKSIPPDTAADIMSYNGSRWTSVFTWQNVLSAMLAKVGPPMGGGMMMSLNSEGNSPGSGSMLLLARGRIDLDAQSARFDAFYCVPESVAPAANVAESRADADRAASEPHPFYARLLGASGQLLSQTAVLAREIEVEETNQLHFAQFVDCPDGVRIIQLVRDNQVLAERIVSPNPPELSLGARVEDSSSQTMSLNWTASDSDGDPLSFTLQYSPDNGASWRALRTDYPYEQITFGTQLLPGGGQALLRVIASDGVNTATATTAPFAVSNHPPMVYIDGVLENQKLDFGAAAELQGIALDPESGMTANHLDWVLSGPTPRNGNTDTLPLAGLSPGAYTATLTAMDTDSLTNIATRHFEVLPPNIPDGPVPVLDGLVNDDGYANATSFQIPVEDGGHISARMFHSSGYLYVGFDGLRLGANGVARWIGLRIDSNNTRTPAAAAGDVGFFLSQEAIPRQDIANNGVMIPTDSPPPGFIAAMRRGANGWSAEFRIDESLLAGWDHAAGLMFEHGATLWPSTAGSNQPISWAQVYFGTNSSAPINRRPVADAGPDQSLNLTTPQTLFLDGTASFDPEMSPLTFTWTQTDGPAVSLTGDHTTAPSFVATPVTNLTTFTFQLVVNDGTADSLPDVVQVTIGPPLSQPTISAPDSGAWFNGNGLALFRLPGLPSQLNQIQTSTDLFHWEPLRLVYADSAGRIDFTHFTTNSPARFFRSFGP
jgi:K319L-like, PKD domain